MDQSDKKKAEKYAKIKENSKKDSNNFIEQLCEEYFPISEEFPEENFEWNKISMEKSEKYKMDVNLGIPGRIEKFYFKQKWPEKYKQKMSENTETECLEKQTALKIIEDDQEVDKTLAEKLRKYCKTVKFFHGTSNLYKSPLLKQPPSTQKRSELNIEKINGKFKLRQPFKILTDIWGVLTSYEFRHELYNYIDNNIESYLNKNIRQTDIQTYVEHLIKRTEIDIQIYPDMPPIINNGNDEQALIKSIIDNIKFRRTHKTDSASLMEYLDCIFNLIWNDG